MIREAFGKLDEYCSSQSYGGWDLYDGLNSILFKKIPFFKSDFMRLVWIQLFKQSPVNLRPITFVPKGINAKGLALFASGMIQLKRYEEAEQLLKQLLAIKCAEKWGISWGYNFPWQARAFYVPAGTPNIVTTVFVANAFLDMFEATEDYDYLQMAKGSGEFILHHLLLFEKESAICFGYIPGEPARVHNANMLGGAFLGRLFKHTGDKALYDKSKKSFSYSMNAMTSDYYWHYGERSHHSFIDNFHTGFNLVALKSWICSTGDNIWEKDLARAYNAYLNTFWLEDGCPKYYNDRLYPIDIHCSAQGIVTCLKLERYDERSFSFAKKIAQWAINNMQDRKGFFYCQKTRYYTNRIPYIRWAQAWMFYALALYISKRGEEK
ncbi:MAG: hypothetical protein JW944_15330 [Deltaproteobacteria bacterium]|nr:hypothetical protein [Deltaproteobacteria bacterium]